MISVKRKHQNFQQKTNQICLRHANDQRRFRLMKNKQVDKAEANKICLI